MTIEFDGREFGWLALQPHHEGELEPGPTVTTMVPVDSAEEWNTARKALQRFLSALAYAYDVRIESRPQSGGSSETDLLHPLGAREVRDTPGVRIAVAPKTVSVAADDRLRLALALYREGLNAGSPFYGFLAFWNVVDGVHDCVKARVNSFLRHQGPVVLRRSAQSSSVSPNQVVTYLRRSLRDAIAHVVPDDPTKVALDPDLPEDRERLDGDREWMRQLARKAIECTWPSPVRTS